MRYYSTTGICEVEGCEREHRSKGYCSSHYARFKYGGDVLEHIPLRFDAVRCSITGCEKRGRRRSGLCKLHYERQYLGIPMDRPLRFEPRVNPRGYVYAFRPDAACAHQSGMALLHRVVMEEHLGRPLLKSETVHHKNGDRADNRLENLELMRIGSHPAGQRVYADLIPYALEVLTTYAPDHLAAKPTQIQMSMEARKAGASKFGFD